MGTRSSRASIVLVILVMAACGPPGAIGQTSPGAAQGDPSAAPVSFPIAATASPSSGQNPGLPPEELEKLLGPIALYPDVLLSQILPASTFPLDIVQAARWLRSKPDMTKLQDQPWDPSVLALCNYPQVLYKMDEDLDWTNALGTAFLEQQKDVMATIQDLRRRAQASGALKSTPEQTVVANQGAIVIAPAQPEVIYVPQYNPQVVYVTQPAQTVVVQEGVSTGAVVAASAVSFGVGLALGAWLNTDCDWYHHSVAWCQPGGWHGYAHGGAAWGPNRVAAWGPNRAMVAGPNGGAYFGPRGAAAWGGGGGGAAWARSSAYGKPSYSGRYSSYNSGNRATQVNRGSGNTVNVNRNNVNVDRGDRTNVSGGNRANVGTGDRTNVGSGNRTNVSAGDRTGAGVSDRMNTAGGNRPTQQPATRAGGSSAFGGESRPSQAQQYSQRGDQSRAGASPQPARTSAAPRPSTGGSSARSSSFNASGSRPQTQSYSSRGSSSRGGGGGFSGGGGGGRGGGGRGGGRR
jgi:hypothetical protein